MIKPKTCKYCHNFYSTLCHKCRVYTDDPLAPDFECTGEKKEVQQNWINYKKAETAINNAIQETE